MKTSLERALSIMKRNTWHHFALIGLLAATASAQDLRVIKSGAGKTALDLSGFTGERAGAAGVFRATLENDLRRSGWFSLSAPGAYAVTGNYEERGGQIAVRCQARDAAGGTVRLDRSYQENAAEARRLAHRVADDLVKALKGVPGIAGTQIVLVGRVGANKELFLMDADGANLRQITHDRSISLAPAWSRQGRRILYTSYRSGFPDAYVIDLGTRQRQCIANFPGMNLAGGFSPDGQEVSLALSRDGNPELYILDLRSRKLTRLTSTPRAAEASSSWSPDGSRIVYVSDRAGVGAPQLYITDRAGNTRLLTSRGRENVAPDWGPNGWIAFTSRRAGRYVVCIAHPDTGEERVVSPADADYEDPSWAPNGRHVVCARTAGHRSQIWVLDTLGDAPVSLTPNSGDWFSPAWSAE